MGKNGKLMRELKKQNTTYTFTRAQLEERDRRLILEHMEKLRLSAQEKALAIAEEHEAKMKAIQDDHWKQIDEEWEKRHELFYSGDFGANMVEFTRLAMMIPLRILVEEFGWKPARPTVKGVPNARYAIVRLHDLCAMAVNDISADELKDIRRYSDEAAKVTGVDFKLTEEKWE